MANRWSDFFKLFNFATEEDPLSKLKDPKQFPSAGVSSPEALNLDNGGQSSLRQSSDMIDTMSLTNRPMRYKEYEKLRNVPEIEMAMQVFADEACVAGDTKIATPFGFVTIKELAEKKADERFLVYSYNFENRDYTLAWAHAPRFVKEAETITIFLDNGSTFTATSDHRVLKASGEWAETGDLKFGDELMPFYRLPANTRLNKWKNTTCKHAQYARVYSFHKGWIHERQFVDDWKSGKTAPEYEQANKAIRMLGGGLTTTQTEKLIGRDFETIERWYRNQGFSLKEIRLLYKKETKRRVIGFRPGPVQKVYDLSVDEHHCFATDNVILHNCQKDEDQNIFKIQVKNDEVRQELNFVLLNRKMLNLNRNGLTWFKNLCIFGDWFVECVVNPENPKEGIYRCIPLPPETMFRIETVRGKVIEFQQAKDGPDYQALTKTAVDDDSQVNQSAAIRFSPSQIIHFKIGDDRKTFFPYGQSLIEPARGPAHNLRLLEDAMLIYRLCLVGDTRIRTFANTVEDAGYKCIKDLKIGDSVFSYEDGLCNPTKVVNCFENGIKEVFRVRSKHVEIIGTKTHPVLVNRDNVVQYVEIQDLCVKKDRLILTKNNFCMTAEIPRITGDMWAKLSDSQLKEFREKKYKNISDLMRKSYCFSRTRQFLYVTGKALPYDKAIDICNLFGLNVRELLIVNKGECNSERIQLPKYVDENFAKLFGFMLGDGNISNTQLNFTTSEDNKVNDFYKNLLKKYFGKVKFQLDKRSKKGLGKYVVSSKTACDIFKKMGYNGNHNIIRIPNWVFNSPINIRRAFIEGLSDADGCERYTKKGTWFSTIELSNKKLIEDIKELWSSCGLCSGHIKTRNRKGGHEIEKGRKMPSTTAHSVTISDLFLPETENVIEVKPFGKQMVYDITVENNEHNFIANCIPVHNSRAPERRIFYIDVGQLAPFRAEAFIDRLKDQFRKRKVTSNRGTPGANSVEEKWQPPAQDEDIWMPIRPNSNSRVDTLPGAENLGEIDDAVYFRNKLLTALNFPKNYFNNEDPNATRITLSAQDVKFARMIERLQSHFEDGLMELAERHLQLRGFPEESYQDLKIKMTPPSDWRELSRGEVLLARYGYATTLKSGQLMSDYDIYLKIFKFTEEDSEEMLARLKLQKLEDLKLQVLAQNPTLLGIGIPGQENPEQELGSEPGGPNMMPSPEDGQQPQPPEGQPEPLNSPNGISQIPPEGITIPEPNEDDIKKYDLAIQTYESDQDKEGIDYSIEDEW